MTVLMASRWDAHPLEPIARLVQARTGIDLDGIPGAHAAATIEQAMREAGHDDPARYLALLRLGAAAFDALVDALTVGESYFFRDHAQLAFVAREILPAVRERARDGGDGLRAWSAGCAGGEEPSSLAILLDEHRALDGAFLLATDISGAALLAARRGVYRPWSLRGEGAHRARPYLAERPEGLLLSPRIREAVTYRRLNLAEDDYSSAAAGTVDLDLVLCRNVLIYLDPPTIARVADGLARSLRPGGWLVTGASDPPLGGIAGLEVEVRPEGVFYRKPERAPSPRPSRAQGGPPSRSRERTTSLALVGRSIEQRDEVPREEPVPAEAGGSRTTDALQELAATDPARAHARVAALLAERPLDVELRHLHASLLLALDRTEEAERALRELLALDSSCALAHFLLADLELRRGDAGAARRSLRAAAREARALGAGAAIPYGDGHPAAQLAAAAEARLRSLDARRSRG